jgi:hypothetical protein
MATGAYVGERHQVQNRKQRPIQGFELALIMAQWFHMDQWLMPVVLATQKAATHRSTAVRSQSRQILSKTIS